MKKWTYLIMLLLLLGVVSTAQAQVPQIINYQGRVAVNGVNFNGTGLFKFALVSTFGTTTYWSNDGTSSMGSQPTSAVTLTVSGGLYSVLLGDTTVTNMTAVPASVFSNSDVRLRVWFNDGTDGWQLLTPDARIASVGYAMVANNVVNGAITSAQIANGAVGSSQIASGAVGSTQIAAGAIGNTQLATNITFNTLSLPATTNSTTGVLTIGGTPFLQGYGGNVLIGGAGNFNMTGSDNIANGPSALLSNTTGSYNIANGLSALQANTTGYANIANGGFTLYDNSTGYENIANGFQALFFNTTGYYNIANGLQTLQDNTTGYDNVANGGYALESNTTGNNNVADGGYALLYNTTGSNNIAIGYVADGYSASGNNNIEIGNQGTSTDNNVIYLGTQGTQTNTFIAGIYGATNVVANTNSALVFILPNGQLGATAGGEITSAQIANGAVGSAQIASGAVGASQIATGAVGSAQIAPNAVGTSQLATNVVVSYAALAGNVANGAITSAQIANGAVGSSQIAAGAIGSAQLATNITFNNIALPATSFTNGVVSIGGVPFLQGYGVGNAFVGYAGNFTMSGGTNVATGGGALYNNTSGALNVANGSQALFFNTTGSNNVAVGPYALYSNRTGSNNTAVGYLALCNSSTNSLNNIAIGYQAGYNAIGNNNIEIGNSITNIDYNVIRLGSQNTQTNTYIAGIYGVTNVVANTNSVPVYILPNGQLGAAASPVGLVPTGGLIAYASTNAPTGYLSCNGTAYATSSYPTLFSTIGYTYGGSGGTFKVPLLTNAPAGIYIIKY